MLCTRMHETGSILEEVMYVTESVAYLTQIYEESRWSLICQVLMYANFICNSWLAGPQQMFEMGQKYVKVDRGGLHSIGW